MNKSSYKSVILFSISFFSGRMSELLTVLTGQLGQSDLVATRLLTLVTPNPEQVILTRSNPKFLQAVQAMDLRIPDGIGLIYASKIFSWRYGADSLSQRLPGKAVVAQLLASVWSQPITVLVIGGRSLGNGPMMAHTVHQLKPIVLRDGVTLESKRWFWMQAYRQAAHPTLAEEELVRTAIVRLRPSLVLVALGAPEQELWLATHRKLLAANRVRLAMAVGGSFDVLTGALYQPPSWVERLGLEWLFRLWQEPWRWRRQLALVWFIGLVLTGVVSRRDTGLSKLG